MFVFTLERIDDYTPSGMIIDVTRNRAQELFADGKIADPAVEAKIHDQKYRTSMAFASGMTMETDMELSDDEDSDTTTPQRKARK